MGASVRAQFLLPIMQELDGNETSHTWNPHTWTWESCCSEVYLLQQLLIY